MYPSDDGLVRARLLIAQCREARRRLEQVLAESLELRARIAAAAAVEPSGVPTPGPPPRHDLAGGGARDEPASAGLARARHAAGPR
jgi:hypothetical protein